MYDLRADWDKFLPQLDRLPAVPSSELISAESNCMSFVRNASFLNSSQKPLRLPHSVRMDARFREAQT